MRGSGFSAILLQITLPGKETCDLKQWLLKSASKSLQLVDGVMSGVVTYSAHLGLYGSKIQVQGLGV